MKRPRWPLPTGARVKTMEEIENMARIEARDGPADPSAAITHEAAHDALVQVNSYPDSTAKMSAARSLQRYIEQQRERDAKLERAMTVVEAAIAWQSDTGGCHFCGFGHVSYSGGMESSPAPHDADCPLVASGFISQGGERLP